MRLHSFEVKSYETVPAVTSLRTVTASLPVVYTGGWRYIQRAAIPRSLLLCPKPIYTNKLLIS